MIEFITETGNTANVDERTRKRIRSHAMKHVRQRQKQDGASNPHSLLRAVIVDGWQSLMPNCPDTVVLSGQRESVIAEASDSAWRQHRLHAASTRSRQPSQASTSESSAESTSSDDDSPDETDETERRPEQSQSQSTQALSFEHYVLAKVNIMLSRTWSYDIPSTVNNKRTYRRALIDAFVTSYLGDSGHLTRDSALSLRSWESPATSAEEAAFDALGLLHLGSLTGDNHLVLAGNQRHVSGTACLNRDLQFSRTSDCLATASTILICEIFSQVSSRDRTWNALLPGISEILRATSGQITSSASAGFFFQHFRHFSLVHSLLCWRRTVDEQTWQRCSEAPLQGNVENLVQLALQLPSLLEITQNISSRASQQNDERTIAQIRARLLHFDRAILSWLADRYNDDPMNRSADDLNDVSIFRSNDEPNIAMSGLRFRSYLNANYHSFCWICLLLIRQALLSISDHILTITQKHELITKATECADCLCRSLPYLWNMGGGLVNKAFGVRAPVHFASKWFERTRHDAKLHWCQQLEGRLRAQVSFLEWDFLLPFSLNAIYLLA